MTTTVTVQTHDWPAKVSTFPIDEDGQPTSRPAITHIAPNSVATFHPTKDQEILVTELPCAAERGNAANARDDQALREGD